MLRLTLLFCLFPLAASAATVSLPVEYLVERRDFRWSYQAGHPLEFELFDNELCTGEPFHRELRVIGTEEVLVERSRQVRAGSQRPRLPRAARIHTTLHPEAPLPASVFLHVFTPSPALGGSCQAQSAGGGGGTGPTGPEGPPGPRGAVGPVGPQGPSGPSGETGDPGPEGAVGARGPRGFTGATGATGATGPIGPTGTTGEAGPPGPPGLTGPPGVSGDLLVVVDANGVELGRFAADDGGLRIFHETLGLVIPMVWSLGPGNVPVAVLASGLGPFYTSADCSGPAFVDAKGKLLGSSLEQLDGAPFVISGPVRVDLAYQSRKLAGSCLSGAGVVTWAMDATPFTDDLGWTFPVRLPLEVRSVPID